MINKKALQYLMSPRCTQAERIYLCEKDFSLFLAYYFTEYIKYPFAPFHFEMFQDLEGLMTGKYRELLWLMFRESAKTSIAKIFLTYIIVFEKRKYLNVDSFDKENSERVLFDIVHALQTNRKIITDFGQLYNSKRDPEESTIKRVANFVTNNGIRVEAHSTQESVRGRLHGDQRPDFVLLDDFETNKTKDSQAYTAQVVGHIDEFKAGLSPDAWVIYLGNYITEFGSIATIIERSKIDPRLLVRNVPVLIDDAPSWPGKYVLTDAEAKETGKVSIEDKRRLLGYQVFNAEMMNLPIDETTSEFKKAWFRYFTDADIKDKVLDIYITVDLAISKSSKADNTCILVAGKEKNKPDIYIIEYLHGKIDPLGVIEGLFSLYQKYRNQIVKIGIETVAYQEAIIYFLQEEMRRRQTYLPIAELKTTNLKKEQRIRGLIPMCEIGILKHRNTMSELENEFVSFPRGQHDDIIDCVAYLPELLQPTIQKIILRQDYTPSSAYGG
jgi:predicted phage terminase large subunit-like protein